MDETLIVNSGQKTVTGGVLQNVDESLIVNGGFVKKIIFRAIVKVA